MMGFAREDQLFSLCGLNCGLCPMQLDGYCPGCGGGAGGRFAEAAEKSEERLNGGAGPPSAAFRVLTQCPAAPASWQFHSPPAVPPAGAFPPG